MVAAAQAPRHSDRVTRQGTEKPLHSTRASGQAEGHFRGSRAEGAGGNQGAGRACHTTYCIACMPFPQLKNVKEPGRRVWGHRAEYREYKPVCQGVLLPFC